MNKWDVSTLIIIMHHVYSKPYEKHSGTLARSSFIVPQACRNSLARTSGSPACSTVNFDEDWPVCELRTLIDTSSLTTVVKIVGAVEVIL